MNTYLRKLYTRERALGFRAADAYRNAVIRWLWEDLQARGLVALRIIPDTDPDISWADIDTLARAHRHGCWGIVGEYRCPCCGQWVQASSIWGFVGDDWRDSGYDTSVMQETLEARLGVSHNH